LCPIPLNQNELPRDKNVTTRWIVIPATQKNSYTKLELPDEKMSINYVAISKLITIVWRAKKSFFSTVRKVSCPHVFSAPFGLYSIPSKASVYLGPYAKEEIPRAKLLTTDGQAADPKTLSFMLLPPDVCKDARPSREARELEIVDAVVFEMEKPINVEESIPLEAISSPSTNVEKEKQDLFVGSSAGFFSCNQDMPDLPFVLLENGKCQFKNPMGKRILLFDSPSYAVKFLAYIYQYVYPDVGYEWTSNLGISSKCNLKDYTAVKSRKVSG
jgi:hypothetical protein